LTLLVGWQEGHPACKKTEWWGAGVVICLERGADLHMAQLMPLPLTVCCSSKIQIGFTFLVLADPGTPGQGPLNECKRVLLCWIVLVHSFKLATIKQLSMLIHMLFALTAKCLRILWLSVSSSWTCLQYFIYFFDVSL